MRDGVSIGARWDGGGQNARLRQAFDTGLIDFVEANYPVGSGPDCDPSMGIPVYVHSPANSVASPTGLNRHICEQVKAAATRFDSPWIGEHLCATGPEAQSRLGYIVNPILDPRLADVAVENARALQRYYGRPLALELGPQYQRVGEMPSEMHFLGDVARRADCHIVLDIAHYTASNRNLRRSEDYGLDALDPERSVEIHLAGLRTGKDRSYWHDAHERLPDDGMVAMAKDLAGRLPNLRAITFEHEGKAPEADFFAFLTRLREELS